MRCCEFAQFPVEYCKEDETVEHCAQLMRDRNIGFVPVVDPNQKLTGVITDRDLVLRVLAAGRAVHTPLRKVMTQDVLVCHVNDELSVAEAKLSRNMKSRLVVIDDDGRCKGVISLADIAQLERPALTGTIYGAVTRREVKPAPTPPAR